MPPGDVPAHQRKARHNEKFFRAIAGLQTGAKSYPDWFVTTIFYVAVHYVDAKLAKIKVHPLSHKERDTLVSNQLRAISAQYFFLKQKSELARYFPDSEKTEFPISVIRQCVDQLALIEASTGLKTFSTSSNAAFA